MPAADLFSGLNSPVIVMDGGLGSTLEKICKTPIVATPLWSAEALDKEPEAIVAAHLAFLRAGAKIIETSTYQCSFDTFKRAGYSSGEAWLLMRKSVLLAQQARAMFEKEMQLNNNEEQQSKNGGSNSPRIRLCLSLGPFGASLKPTQEFGGFYPPPYGPREYTTNGPNTNFIGDEKAEAEAIEALAGYHSERLLLFAQDSEIWSYIDMIAFETVPLAREAVAIRYTMARFEEKNVDVDKRKQWWISFVFPEGRCPQMMDMAGTNLPVPDLVREVLSLSLCGGRSLPIPHGFGVNCTNVGYLPRIINEMKGACEQIRRKVRPFLVLYPNGGGEFDENLGVWKEGVSEETKNEWRITLVDLVDNILSSPDVQWSGVIAGGCCRCGAEQISRLSNLLKY